MTKKEKRELDIQIWQMLWPIVLLTLVQKLGSAFEGILVSVNHAEELTVISICSPYITLISTVSYGLGIAINSMTGQFAGKGLWESCCRRAIRFVLRLLLAAGFIMSVITVFLLVQAFRSAPELRATGFLYMLPYLMESPVMLLFNALISGMRGFKDSKTGMYMTCMIIPLQLILSWLLYTGFGLPALGYGMLLARIAGCVYGVRHYRRKFVPENILDKPLPTGFAGDFLRLAVPVSLSKMIGPMAHTLLNGLLLSIGSAYVGASGLGGRLEGFFYMPAMAMGSVAITLTAQQKNDGNMPVLIRRLCIWSVTPTLLMVLVAESFAGPIWGMLTADAALQAAGAEYWHICLLAYPFIALEMTTTGILQACGCGMPALVITLIRLWCIQLPAAWLSVRYEWGASGVWIGFLLSNVVSLAVSVFWARKKLKANKFGKKEKGDI